MENGRRDSWLKALIERITGATFAAPDDPRFWHCRPLVVTNEAREVVFAGNALVEFTPEGVDEGAARLVKGAPEVPPIRASRVTVTHSGDRAKTPNGLMLRGIAPNGERLTWRINGAATAFLKRRVHERWLGVEDGFDVGAEPRDGSLGTLE